MPLNVVCGACGKQFTVPDHYAGRTGACTQCGKPVVAQAPAAMTSSSESAFGGGAPARAGAVALAAPPAAAPPAAAAPPLAPAAPGPSVSIGNTLGGYRLARKLGDAKSSVFLATSPKGQSVALKVLPDQITSQFPTAAKRFLREARSLFGLTHDNVVTVLDAGEELGCLYLAMELFEGRTARELLDQQRKVPAAQAVSIALGVARALTHLDGHKLVHRNVKPEHILVGADGKVKLCGLGLVKGAESDSPLTVRGHIVGTPQYLSPEQAEGSPDVDIRADLWGLGVTLYELLTGAPPWNDRNAMKVLQLIGQAPMPPLPPDVDPALALVVGKLLTKDVKGRYQTPDVLAKDLAAIEEGRLGGEEPPSFHAAFAPVAAAAAAKGGPEKAGAAAGGADVKRLTLLVGLLAGLVVLLLIAVVALVALR